MDIAKRQEISEKYLEGILAVLSRDGFVSALRGRGGGYKLSRSPQEYTVGSILKAADGPLAPVACLETPENACPRADSCRTLPLWTKLDHDDAEYKIDTLPDSGVQLRAVVIAQYRLCALGETPLHHHVVFFQRLGDGLVEHFGAQSHDAGVYVFLRLLRFFFLRHKISLQRRTAFL